ncbi:hypothetical protein CASFOL_027753 [Castilleja foliolosa]|uniref:Uncharacterized protein n=1 Tax=Castilleja foliolosa TaxID=1961234 RepID=A0ABD3CGK9_9LAMI
METLPDKNLPIFRTLQNSIDPQLDWLKPVILGPANVPNIVKNQNINRKGPLTVLIITHKSTKITLPIRKQPIVDFLENTVWQRHNLEHHFSNIKTHQHWFVLNICNPIGITIHNRLVSFHSHSEMKTHIDGAPRIGITRVYLNPNAYFFLIPCQIDNSDYLKVISLLIVPKPYRHPLFIRNFQVREREVYRHIIQSRVPEINQLAEMRDSHTEQTITTPDELGVVGHLVGWDGELSRFFLFVGLDFEQRYGGKLSSVHFREVRRGENLAQWLADGLEAVDRLHGKARKDAEHYVLR